MGEHITSKMYIPQLFVSAPETCNWIFVGRKQKGTRTTLQPTLIQQGPVSVSIVVWCPVVPNTAFLFVPKVTSKSIQMNGPEYAQGNMELSPKG